MLRHPFIVFVIATLLGCYACPAFAQFNYYSMYWDGHTDFSNRYDDALTFSADADSDMGGIFQGIIDEDYDQARFIYYQRMITNYCTNIGNFWSEVADACGEEVGIEIGGTYLMSLDESHEQYLDPNDAYQHALDRLDRLWELEECCASADSWLQMLASFEQGSGITISGGVYPTGVAISNNNAKWDEVIETIENLQDWMESIGD